MRKYLILSFFFLLPFSSFAQENNYFLMLKNKKVNVRYGPSFDYPIKYVYRKIELPLKVIDKKENFRRVIDHKKNSGSKPLAKLDKGRLLKVIKCEEKWCNISTGDYSGWILKDDKIWGIVN